MCESHHHTAVTEVEDINPDGLGQIDDATVDEIEGNSAEPQGLMNKAAEIGRKIMPTRNKVKKTTEQPKAPETPEKLPEAKALKQIREVRAKLKTVVDEERKMPSGKKGRHIRRNFKGRTLIELAQLLEIEGFPIDGKTAIRQQDRVLNALQEKLARGMMSDAEVEAILPKFLKEQQ